MLWSCTRRKIHFLFVGEPEGDCYCLNFQSVYSFCKFHTACFLCTSCMQGGERDMNPGTDRYIQCIHTCTCTGTCRCTCRTRSIIYIHVHTNVHVVCSYGYRELYVHGHTVYVYTVHICMFAAGHSKAYVYMYVHLHVHCTSHVS